MDEGGPIARQRGFTLLEVLIVVSIVVIIASIGVPQYVSALRTARIGKAKHELVIMAEAIDSYMDNNDGHMPLTLYQVGFGGRRDPWGVPYCYLNYKDGSGDGLDWAIAAGIVDPAAVKGTPSGTTVSHGSFLPASSTRRPQLPIDALRGVTQAVVDAAKSTTADVASTLTRVLSPTETDSLVKVIATTPGMTFFSGVATEPTRRRDRYMFPLNTDYDLFSLGPDSHTAVSLGDKMGQDDIIRANNGGYYGTASEYLSMRTWLMRRRYIVDWKLQGNLCLHGLFYGGLVLIAIGAGIFAPLLWNLGDLDVSQQEELSIVMLYLHERFWGLAFLCAIIVVVSAVRSSHRIAGPLVRYKRNLRLLATGRLPEPLRTRRGDYMQEEVACLNAAVRGVAERVDAIRVAHAALNARVDAITRDASVDAKARQALAAADRELASCIVAFQHHDTGDDRAREEAVPLLAPAALEALR